MIKTLILTGEGINSHKETFKTFELAGASPQFMHIQEFLNLESLDPWDILAFPGGFSYGDEVRSGKLLAEKIKHFQIDNIKIFNEKRKPIIGICNGFQILIQMGLFEEEKRTITLSENIDQQFKNNWCLLEKSQNDSFWLKNLPSQMHMTIRHKEGRFIAEKLTSFRPAFTYQEDQNGSFMNIAGITNNEGNILGLMPHPEASAHEKLSPKDQQMTKDNIQLFRNAVNYCKRMRQ